MTTSSIFYYVRVVLLSALLLGVVSAYAETPPSQASSAMSDRPITIAVSSYVSQGGGTTAAAGRNNDAQAATLQSAGDVPGASATEPRASRFRDTMKDFFGPNLNVKLRQ